MISTKKASSTKKSSKTTTTSGTVKTAKPVAAEKNGPRRSGAATEKPSAKRTMTRVTVKYDVGFPNQLFLRGEGPDLEWSWEEGIPLKNVAPDTWVWETRKSFGEASFKVLVNDEQFEHGENHKIAQGSSLEYTPSF